MFEPCCGQAGITIVDYIAVPSGETASRLEGRLEQMRATSRVNVLVVLSVTTTLPTVLQANALPLGSNTHTALSLCNNATHTLSL